LLAAATSLLGALLPLLVASVLPGPGWIAAALATTALGALGASLASVVLANRLLWAVILLVGGVAVTAVGAMIQ